MDKVLDEGLFKIIIDRPIREVTYFNLALDPIITVVSPKGDD